MHFKNSISILNNAKSQKKLFFFLSFNKKVLSLLKALKKEGFISHFFKKNGQVIVLLKQNQKGSYESRLKNLTKAGLVNKISFYEIWKLQNQPGLFFLNSCVGLLSEKKARILKLGGNLLFCIK